MTYNQEGGGGKNAVERERGGGGGGGGDPIGDRTEKGLSCGKPDKKKMRSKENLPGKSLKQGGLGTLAMGKKKNPQE